MSATDEQAFLDLMKRFGLSPERRDAPRPNSTCVDHYQTFEIDDTDGPKLKGYSDGPKLKGYSGFFVDFAFAANGEFLFMGIWE